MNKINQSIVKLFKKICRFFVKRYFDNSYWRKKFLSLVKIEDLDSTEIKLNLTSPKTIFIFTPEIETMNLHARAKYLQKSTYSIPSINTATLNYTRYSPRYNILLTNSRKIISDSINTDFFEDVAKFSISHLYFSEEEKISELCTVLRSTNNSYYHTLIDNIPRFFLIENYLKENPQEIKLLLGSQPTKIEAFFISKLSNSNLKVKLLNNQKVYLIDKLVFPSFLTCRCAGYLPSSYLDYFLDKVTPLRPRKKQNRIFISRIATNKGNLRRILNEDELLDRLSQYGFKKYILENLPITEQIELFYDADFVIGTHGAGLSNLVFSRQVRVLDLFPTESILPHYYYLSKSTNNNYAYWCGKETNRDANFYVNTPEIIEIIDNLTGCFYDD